jgi:hypothetical protein
MKTRFLPLLALGLTVHYCYADPASISIDLASAYRPVTHAASGSLYGLSFDGVPPDSVIDPLNPRMFTQMAPNGHQLPNGTTQPTGDALKVAPAAARAAAEVTIRMPDWYPTFPYQWVSWQDWTSAVQQQLAAKLASPNITNIYGWELWNEPDFTWDVQHAGPFNDGWLKTYQLVRGTDPHTPIVGPSATHYYADFLQPFLSFCKVNNVLPDVVSWHELATGGNADVEGHVAAYRQLEEQLGITPRRVSINEYGRVYDMGAPGFLLRYIARVERAGVDSACLAFWHLPGRLGDLLDANARPNGAWWLYKWYGDFSGRMVSVTPPASSGFGLDAAASFDNSSNIARVLVGGTDGDTLVTIQHLPADLRLGGHAHVQVASTAFTGTDGASPQPDFLFEGDYPVINGNIVVPVNDMLSSSAYNLIVTAGPTSKNPKYRYEAESALFQPAQKMASTAASDGMYVSGLGRKNSHVAFLVFAPKPGPYGLTIRYGDGTGSEVTQQLAVNGGTGVPVSYQPTAGPDTFATLHSTVQLRAGLNLIRLSQGAQAAATDLVSLDYIEVRPYRARYEAEQARISDANITISDPNNFFSTYSSNGAYVAQINNLDSYVDFTVNAPVGGTYRMIIHYTNGTKVDSQQGLSVNSEPFTFVTYPATQGWGLFGLLDVNVQLQNGINHIRLAKGDPSFGLAVGYAELDCIDLEYVYP